jgi:hypothetical protein
MSFEQRHRRHDTIVGSLSGPVHDTGYAAARGHLSTGQSKNDVRKKTLPCVIQQDPVGSQRVRYLFPVGIFVAQRDDAAENAKPIMVGSPPCGKGHVIARLGINMLTNIAFQGLIRTSASVYYARDTALFLQIEAVSTVDITDRSRGLHHHVASGDCHRKSILIITA